MTRAPCTAATVKALDNRLLIAEPPCKSPSNVALTFAQTIRYAMGFSNNKMPAHRSNFRHAFAADTERIPAKIAAPQTTTMQTSTPHPGNDHPLWTIAINSSPLAKTAWKYASLAKATIKPPMTAAMIFTIKPPRARHSNILPTARPATLRKIATIRVEWRFPVLDVPVSTLEI